VVDLSEKLMHKIFFCLTISILILVKPANSQELDDGVHLLNEKTVKIVGRINSGFAERFAKLDLRKIELVILDSEGGQTSEALAIAEKIERYKLDILVDGVCFSSCANYLFVSGRKKSSTIGSLVGFHGGHSNIGSRKGESVESLVSRKNLLKHEQALYLRKNVSIDLIVYSGLITHRVIDSSGSPKSSKYYTIWIPSKNELERLGVDGVGEFWAAQNDERLTWHMEELGFENAKPFSGRLYSYVPAALLNPSNSRSLK
jgi:hypothetical protein